MTDIGHTTGTTGNLNLNNSVISAIDFEGDNDWYRIHLNAGDQVRFDLEGIETGVGTLADPSLQILDSNGNVIVSNDDINYTSFGHSDNQLNSRVDFTASYTGDYYVSAASYDYWCSLDVGTYRLTATEMFEADLVVSAGSITRDTNSPNRLRLDVTVDNVGNGKAGRSRVAYYLSDGTTATFLGDFLGDDYVGMRHAAGHQYSSQSEHMYFDVGSANLADGSYSIYAVADYQNSVAEWNEGNNRLTLGTFTVQSGGAGDDTLVSQVGYDQLTGGGGADTFVFGCISDGADTITDFNAAEGDRIGIVNYGVPAGSTIAFQTGSSATGTGATFVFNNNTGMLSYDSDGAGSAAAVQIAQLGQTRQLAAGSIVAV